MEDVVNASQNLSRLLRPARFLTLYPAMQRVAEAVGLPRIPAEAGPRLKKRVEGKLQELLAARGLSQGASITLPSDSASAGQEAVIQSTAISWDSSGNPVIAVQIGGKNVSCKVMDLLSADPRQ